MTTGPLPGLVGVEDRGLFELDRPGAVVDDLVSIFFFFLDLGFGRRRHRSRPRRRFFFGWAGERLSTGRVFRSGGRLQSRFRGGRFVERSRGGIGLVVIVTRPCTRSR